LLITRVITDQIGLHSVLLPLLIVVIYACWRHLGKFVLYVRL